MGGDDHQANNNVDRLKLFTPTDILKEAFWLITKSAPKLFFLVIVIFMIPLSFSRQIFYQQLPSFFMSYSSYIDEFILDDDRQNILLTRTIYKDGFLMYFILKYFIFIIIYLLSIFAVVSVVTSIYASSSSSRQQHQVPMIRPFSTTMIKRLLITFFVIFLFKINNNVSFWVAMLILKSVPILQQNQDLLVFISNMFRSGYLTLDTYHTNLWIMSSIVTILEYSKGVFGYAAFERADKLLRGKHIWATMTIGYLCTYLSTRVTEKGVWVINLVVVDLIWFMFHTIFYYVRV